MKVALIGPVYPFRGGIAHYTTALYGALSSLEHDVLLLSFQRQYPTWLFPGDSDRDPSRSAQRIDDARFTLDSLNPLTWIAAFRQIARFRPDCLVLQWWTSFWAPLWLTLALLNRLALRSPLHIICHNVVPHDARPVDRWIARQVLRQGDRLLVHSEVERARLLRLLPSATVAVALMPTDSSVDVQRIERTEARRLLDLPLDTTVLLFFGIVRPYKGLDRLLRALPRIGARADVLLLVAGEFWESRADYDALIAELGIGERVRIDDRYVPNEEITLFFSAADLFVAPYRRSSNSGALGLAASLGLPIVTTRGLFGNERNANANGDPPAHADEQVIDELVRDIVDALAGRGEQPPLPQGDWPTLVRALLPSACTSAVHESE